ARDGVTATAVELELQTLERDAEIVRRAIAAACAANHSVVVAGHSYGGMVISAAGHEADELVYVCAVLPDAGASMLDMLFAADLSEYAKTATEVNVDGAAVVKPERAPDALFHRCSAEDAEAAITRLRPLAGSCMSTAVADPAWLRVEASYVVCTDDRS